MQQIGKMLVTISPVFKLNNGTSIPCIGVGTWQQKNPDIIEFVIKEAIKIGYRHIDTATVYRNEEAIGDTLQDVLSDPEFEVERGDLWITTKIAPTEQGYARAKAAVESSLRRLKLDYLDAVLIHWPGTAKLKPTDSANRWHRQESWRALEELQRAGKIRTIGVSNYLVRHLEEMKEYATIPPAINQCEFHPLLFNKGLLGYCNKNGILLEAYSSLGEGHLVNGDEDLPELDEISHRHQIPPVQILLKWALQHGVAVIPKASSAEHLLENFEATRFELSPEEMAKLDSISECKQKRFCWDSSKII